MKSTLGRILNTMRALKSSTVAYAIIDGDHMHILYRGFYLGQRCWSDILKICSNGSYIAWVTAVDTQAYYLNVLKYMNERADTGSFINWDHERVLLKEFL